MPRIRVLLSALSQFRGDVVRRIVQAQPDMMIVNEFVEDDELLSGRAADVADVLIVGMDEQRLPAMCSALLYAQPGIKVLAMEDGDGDALLYEMRPHKVRLGNVSADGLVEAIRHSRVVES